MKKGTLGHVVKPRQFERAPFFRAVAFVLTLAVVIAGMAFAFLFRLAADRPNTVAPSVFTFQRFTSPSEFRQYIASAGQLDERSAIVTTFATPELSPPESSTANDASVPAQVSQTNVQIVGIDEPDIVKTDGASLFISQLGPVALPLVRERFFVHEMNRETEVVTAFPLEKLETASTIDASGELLIHENSLIVLGNNSITGVNVADTKNPQEVWKHELEGQNIAASRLINGRVYVVTRRAAIASVPCPMPLVKGVSLDCSDIYHPTTLFPSDTTYTIMRLSPEDGSIEQKVGFVGATSDVVIYVSAENIYISYTTSEKVPALLYNFFITEVVDILPISVITRLQQAQGLNLTTQAKLVELETLINAHKRTLLPNERLAFETNIKNRMSEYAKAHIEEIETSVVVRVGTDNFEITGSAEVPGKPLNQFALDEHGGALRIATTINPQRLGAGQSVNNLYIFDNNMSRIGTVTNLAPGEQVFAARYIGDKAYLVTFEQVDPFFVIDLKDPTEPRVTGELKIPGFSTYLHPLTDTLILGVGQEEEQVKLSLFDVSEDTPREVSRFLLSEPWTEVNTNHHAFLQDPEHEAFFLPAGENDYIFSYSGGVIKLSRAIPSQNASRAVFINDYLYLISPREILVLDETDWSNAANLELQGEPVAKPEPIPLAEPIPVDDNKIN